MENENNDYYEPAIKTSRTTTSNTNYYQLDYANELTKLNIEKQQLISFLEERIKENKKVLEACCSEDPRYIYRDGINDTLQEVLDFVNKGGKDE